MNRMWHVRRWRSGAVFCALVALSGWCSLGCRQGAAPGREFDGEVLRLVTWNVRKCESGVETVAGELERLNADVICLQEVTERAGTAPVDDQSRQIAERLGMYAYSYGAPLGDGRNQCVAVLSRVPLMETEPLDAGTGRNYGVTAVMGWRGRRLRIVSIHLAGTYKANWQHIVQSSRERVQESEHLRGQLGQWPAPVVVAGDLNTMAGTKVYEALTERLTAAPLKGATFPSDRPLLALDRVFFSPDLAVLCVEISDSRASDHRPVVAELVAPQR